MWTWKPDYRKAAGDAFFLTFFFIGAYGDMRTDGIMGFPTLYFLLLAWYSLHEKPGDYIESSRY